MKYCILSSFGVCVPKTPQVAQAGFKPTTYCLQVQTSFKQNINYSGIFPLALYILYKVVFLPSLFIGSSSAHRVKMSPQDKTKLPQLLQRQTSSLPHQAGDPIGQQPMHPKMADKQRQNNRENLLEKLWSVVKHLTVQVCTYSCLSDIDNIST